jgi:hypothetical protein
LNEQELRDGLHEVMVASSPPPMNPNTALDAGRRAHRRRRATLAGAAVGVAVAAVATSVVFLGGGQPQELPVATQPGDKAGGSVTDTKPSWPNGQTDRTAHNGPRAERGTQLYDALVAALPGTLTLDSRASAPQKNSDPQKTGGDPLPLSMKQAQFEEMHGQVEVWRYTAIASVVRKTQPAAGTGQVYAEILTPGSSTPADLCQAASQWWRNKGDCTITDVQGKKVAVIAATRDERISQVAAYRYDDGTLVVTAQGKDVPFTSLPGLDGPPLTLDQLAALALNPALKLT